LGKIESAPESGFFLRPAETQKEKEAAVCSGEFIRIILRRLFLSAVAKTVEV
jgi:hypothetical protein